MAVKSRGYREARLRVLVAWLNEGVGPIDLIREVAMAMAWRRRGVDNDRVAYDAIRAFVVTVGGEPVVANDHEIVAPTGGNAASAKPRLARRKASKP